MNKIISFFLLVFTLTAQAQDETKKVTEEDYSHAVQFLNFNTYPLVYNGNVNPHWMANGNFWYQNTTKAGKEYIWVRPENGKKQTASSKDALFKEHNFAPEEKPEIKRTEIPSPDGTKVVFIRDWNLWMRNLKNDKETQLTTDGVENYGYATDNAGWKHSDRPIVLWSPDSKKIATFQQDQRHVSDMYLIETKVGAPKLETWKYPIAQDSAIIQIERVIINIEKPAVLRLKMPADPRRGTLCDDIACSGSFDDNEWSPDSKQLAFVTSSRDHKIATLKVADAETGDVHEVLQEKVATQYESGQGTINWHFLPDSNEIIWYSEKDNWGHLYLYNLETGKLKNQITKGDFVVTEMLHVDKKDRKLYFMANGREKDTDPYFSYFYSIDFDGNHLKLLTPEKGNHSVSLSPQGNYFVDNYSQPDVAPVSVLRNRKGKEIKILEKTDISQLKASGWKPPKPITVKSRNGKWDLYGLMYTPTNLNELNKYPVINYIYPGPQGGGVGPRSFYPSRGDHQALAELGFIVVVIDGTCNPGRSKDFHDACYGNMADNTLEDQISGIKQLAEKYPYFDLNKIGVWGHSGGGFAAAAAMFRYPEFYKVGISESGNHDNRNYEDDWGERYIGLIQPGENGKTNYEEQANQNLAKNLQGKLLLAHGGMDDNVPPSNTYLVVDALIKANKDFDLVIFPNAHHGYRDDSYYMMRRRWDYFVENLMGATPPKNFEIKP
ncbi:MAG TPA: S9 family peptidase [Leeuwenhoekiella sp.]|nr:S9 family peptidase [Leeuwenhoekiella sp.]